MPRRPYRRERRRRRLQRAGLRPLPPRRRSALRPGRAGAPAAHRADTAIAAATRFSPRAGLQVALCHDFAGRIIDRLVRPYYNARCAASTRGLATAEDLDLTLHLGLGYPVGPIALLQRSGLHHHFDVTEALFEALRRSRLCAGAARARRQGTAAAQRRELTMRPLDGVRVLDFSTLLPGPMATLILAEAGAEVIKIERPGSGDEMRGYAPAPWHATASISRSSTAASAASPSISRRRARSRAARAAARAARTCWSSSSAPA